MSGSSSDLAGDDHLEGGVRKYVRAIGIRPALVARSEGNSTPKYVRTIGTERKVGRMQVAKLTQPMTSHKRQITQSTESGKETERRAQGERRGRGESQPRRSFQADRFAPSS